MNALVSPTTRHACPNGSTFMVLLIQVVTRLICDGTWEVRRKIILFVSMANNCGQNCPAAGAKRPMGRPME